MKKVITNENEYCMNMYDIYWQLGKECLWIELHQKKLETNLTNNLAKGKDFNELVEEA